MLIKKLVAVLLSVCIFVSVAYAEVGENVLDSIGNWFGQAWEDSSKWAEQAWEDSSKWTEQAWNDASKWVEQAWKDASAWLENAWGDASKWIEQVWNDASPKLIEIWGDVSTWATGVYNSVTESVSAWWIDTFKKVTETKDQAWSWIKSTSEDIRSKIVENYLLLLAKVQNGSSNGEKSKEEVYTDLLKKLNLNDADIVKVLQTIKVYADQNGITVESLEEIMLPYLVQLIEDASLAQNGQIPAIAVAQYLTGIMVEEGIGSEEDAQRMINTLKETLNIQ